MHGWEWLQMSETINTKLAIMEGEPKICSCNFACCVWKWGFVSHL